MRKIVAMFLAVSLLLVCTFAQADTEDVVEHNVNLDSRQPTPEEQQRYMSMRRTACLVLSRHHSNSHRDEIEPIIQGLPVEGQQKFINKMYSVAVEDCEQVITPEEVNQLYVENPSFDPSSLFHLFATVDYTALSKDNFKLTKNQETIVQYIKNFDEEMEVKREEQKAEQDKLLGDERNEFKVFGISTKEVGTGAKMAYLLVFCGVVGGLLYYGIRELSKDDKPKKKKSKKAGDASPPKDASPASPKKKND